MLHEIVHENANDKSRFNCFLSQKNNKISIQFVSRCLANERKKEKGKKEVSRWLSECLKCFSFGFFILWGYLR